MTNTHRYANCSHSCLWAANARLNTIGANRSTTLWVSKEIVRSKGPKSELEGIREATMNTFR